MSGPYRVCFCSPLRRRPDAATWPTAHDVSQRAEPDVRPLGRVAAAFIADKMRCLSIPLAGDVTSQHLMSPATPLAGDVLPQYLMSHVPPLRTTTRLFRRRHACPFRWQAARPYYRMRYAHHDSRVTEEAAATYQYYMDYGHYGARRSSGRYWHWIHLYVFPPFCSWAHMLGLSILVRAPLEL
jgi:hypothetical protein